MKSSLIFALTIVGTLIGAGFATGQELLSFFILRSNKGYIYFIFSIVVIILVSLIVLVFARKNHISSLSQLYDCLFDKTTSNIYLIISTVFLFSCFSVTASGTGTLFYENLNWPYFTGVLTILAITYSAMQFNVEGVFFINSILTPLIIIAIIVFGIASNVKGNETFLSFNAVGNAIEPFLYALLYFGYNIFSLFPIILTAERKNSLKCAVAGLIISFLLIVIIGVIMIFIMCNTSIDIFVCNLPFLSIISENSEIYGNIYVSIMYFAMITTAVSCFYGFLKNISSIFLMNEQVIIITGLIVSYFVSFFGFTELVRKIYSIFGIFGIFIAGCIVYKIIRRKVLIKNW